MRLSHGQAPRASELEYSVREKTTDLFCDEARVQKVAHKRAPGRAVCAYYAAMNNASTTLGPALPFP